jgi:hypothetical protein
MRINLNFLLSCLKNMISIVKAIRRSMKKKGSRTWIRFAFSGLKRAPKIESDRWWRLFQYLNS